MSNDEVWLKVPKSELCDEATALPSIRFALNLEWPLSKVSKTWRVLVGSMFSELFVCVLAKASYGTIAIVSIVKRNRSGNCVGNPTKKTQISVAQLATTRECHVVQVVLV